MNLNSLKLTINIPKNPAKKIVGWLDSNKEKLLMLVLVSISVLSFVKYLENGLGLAYNDSRSHLDIGRRVVEGLKPGLAQLGSVWLPLPHLLMVPFVWNDQLWHSGLAGAIQSMISFVATAILIYKFLEQLKVGLLGRFLGVMVFVANINILYLQSTAMTELSLLATMMAGCYYLLRWSKDDNTLDLIKSAFWIMLSTLIRYDGWFLLLMASAVIALIVLLKRGYKAAEGHFVLFSTLAGFGIFLWFAWNQLIFKDALYFILGPFSAHAQQAQLSDAGDLPTKYNLLLSTKIFLYALLYNVYTLPAVISIFGLVFLFFDRKLSWATRVAASCLTAPLIFNILALFFGFSVLFIQGISGDTWFNVRYGIMLMPSIAIFVGYFIDRIKSLRWITIGLLFFVLLFAFTNNDAVTIDDARVGSSQKNVSEVSGWLAQHTKDKPGYILISAASHDAIIFSSGLPMAKFIHEGTGAYWESATIAPDRWARWIVMRTNDVNDLTFKFVKDAPGFVKYDKVDSYPFADIYQLKDEYVNDLNTTPVYGKQK